MAPASRVLCVDDERLVIDGLSRSLRKDHSVLTALGGAEALGMLAADPTISVVVSDMQMPGMDGAMFLRLARELAPDAVRILLTGHASLSSAIAAVNEGGIFRFLTKPCPPAVLVAAVDAAIDQHRRMTGERTLIEQTVHGCIDTLVDVLSLTDPVAFARALRIRGTVTFITDRLRISDPWQVEAAAMLSQMGCLSVPGEIVERLHAGAPLNEGELEMVARMPATVESLLARIPRLERVRQILSSAARPRTEDQGSATAMDAGVQLGAESLRVAMHFDDLESQGNEVAEALAILRARIGQYDPRVLDCLTERGVVEPVLQKIKEVSLVNLRCGMTLAQDLRLVNGALLVARGHEITPDLLERVRNNHRNTVREPIVVFSPPVDTPSRHAPGGAPP